MAGKAITFSNTNLPFKGNTVIEYFNEFEFFENTLNYMSKFQDAGFFEGCTNLKEIKLPLNILNSNLGFYSDADKMFFGCTSLRKVVLPEGLTVTRRGMFDYCSNLIYDFFPDTITSFGSFQNVKTSYLKYPLGCTVVDSFTYCNISVLILQENVTTLPSSFNHGGSTGKMFIKATTPPTFGGWGYCGKPSTIYVPLGCGDAYKSATTWSGVANTILEYDFSKDMFAKVDSYTLPSGWSVQTDILPSALTKVEIKFKLDFIGDTYFWGAREGNWSLRYYLRVNGNNINFGMNGTEIVVAQCEVGKDYVVIVDSINKTVTVNGNVTVFGDITSYPNCVISIGKVYTDSDRKFNQTFYYMKIYENNELKRYYIPTYSGIILDANNGDKIIT